MIAVIIPAYEPDEKLISLIEHLHHNHLSPIIVVDDGSVTAKGIETIKVVESDNDIVMLHHVVNMGKGRALKTAFNYCLHNYDDLEGCITIDSDGQHRVEDMLLVMESMKRNPQALVLGCRDFDSENVPVKSAVGNKSTRRAMKIFMGISISDTQTGLRGISSDYMKTLLAIRGDRYEFETNMLLKTKELEIPIVEVPIETIYIDDNKGSHYHPVLDSLRIGVVFLMFFFSSLSSSAIDLVLFSLFCYLFRDYKPRGIITYITLSTVLARILSSIYNFFMNYKVVFRKKGNLGITIVKYYILVIIQMSLSALLVNLLYPLLGGVEVIVKVPVDIFLFIISFFVQRELIYRGGE